MTPGCLNLHWLVRHLAARRCIPLAFLCLLLAVPRPLDGADGVEIETVEGRFTVETTPHLGRDTQVLEIGGVEVPLRDILAIHYPVPLTPPRGSLRILLADRTLLVGDVSDGSDEEKLNLKVKDLDSVLEIPLELIRRVTTAVETIGPSALVFDEDTLVTREGSTLTGVLLLIDSAGISFEDSTLGTLQIPWQRFFSLGLAEIDPTEDLPEGTISSIVELSGGGKIRGALQSSDDQTTVIAHPALGNIRIPAERRRALGFDFNRIVFLSDRDPVEVEEGTPYSDYFPWHWRKDRSVVGGPLRIGSRDYERGLGVHARCSLQFEVEKGDNTFISDIGIDASGRPTDHDSRIGIVVFKVLLDDEVAFQSDPIGWETPPRNVVIPLKGASRLTLVVDIGPGHHVLDRADWGGARIVRD